MQDPINAVLRELQEAQTLLGERRQAYRWAADPIRKVEAAILYAQAADNEATLRARYEEMVVDLYASEMAPNGRAW